MGFQHCRRRIYDQVDSLHAMMREVDVPRYRYVTPTKRGRWCETKEAAENAAVKAGEGYREPWVGGRFYPGVLTKIETQPD